jgi:hypothetical protein
MKMRISDVMLERYHLEELPPDQMNLVRNALSDDPSVKERLDSIIASDNEILSDYPAPFVSGRIRDGLERAMKEKKVPGKCGMSRGKIFGIAFSAAGSIAAAAAIFIFLPVSTALNTNPVSNAISPPAEKIADVSSDIIRTKGKESELYLYRKTNKEPEELSPDSVAVKGDIIQLAFQTKLPYAVIFSIDGRGGVTLHYPVSENASSSVSRGKKIFLPSSYQLDDAPRYERFFLVTSESGINPGFVVSKAREFAKEDAAAMTDAFSIQGAKIESLMLKKE